MKFLRGAKTGFSKSGGRGPHGAVSVDALAALLAFKIATFAGVDQRVVYSSSTEGAPILRAAGASRTPGRCLAKW